MTTKDQLVTAYMSPVLVEQMAQCTMADKRPQTVYFMQTLGTGHHRLRFECNQVYVFKLFYMG